MKGALPHTKPQIICLGVTAGCHMTTPFKNLNLSIIHHYDTLWGVKKHDTPRGVAGAQCT